MDSGRRSPSPTFDIQLAPRRLSLLRSKLATSFRKYKIKIVDCYMVEEEADTLFKCSVCYTAYDEVSDNHLLCLPYCNHCVCTTCFIDLIKVEERRNFRVQVIDEETDTYGNDDDNCYFTCGSFSHKFFRCPNCRMGHMVDRDMFIDLELQVRNIFLERDNMDKESHKVKYLKVVKEMSDLIEKKREVEKERDSVKSELEIWRKEIERLESENSELRRKIEKDKEYYRSSLCSLDFYRAFYCDQNIIVKMGAKLDDLTKKLAVVGRPRNRKRKKRSNDDGDDVKDDSIRNGGEKRAKLMGRRGSKGNLVKKDEVGNVVTVYETSLSSSSGDDSVSTFCSDVEKHTYGIDVSVSKFVNNIDDYTSL